jgi:hypothetical protein
VVFEAAAVGPGTESFITLRKPKGAPSLYSSTVVDNVTWEEVKVPAMTLDEMLTSAKIEKVDFVSIDVEGAELEVLQGFDLNRWAPKLLLIERNSRFRNKPLVDLLQQHNYYFFKNMGVNDFYWRDSSAFVARIRDSFGWTIFNITRVLRKVVRVAYRP